MNRILTVLATVATAAGTVLVVSPSAAASSSCGAHQHAVYDTATDSTTCYDNCPEGKHEVFSSVDDALYCFDRVADTDTPSITSHPAQGTGGLILRDEHGNDLGSGIGEGQQFRFAECGPDGSGLIYVNQTVQGRGGGWGTLYEGYVKAEWTSIPSHFDFCK